MFLVSNLERPTQLHPLWEKAANRGPRRCWEVPTSNRIAVEQRCPPLSALLASCNASVRLREPGEANARCSAQQQAEPWSSRSCAASDGHTALLREAPCAVGGPERSTAPTKAFSLSSAGSALRTPQPALSAWPSPLSAPYLPAANPAPLTGPTRLCPWKSFRTSSALHALASDRPHEPAGGDSEPTRQVCAPILGVPVTPSRAMTTLPARPALQTLEKPRQCDPAAGGSPAALRPRLHLLPKVPRDRPRCSRAERHRVSLSGGSEMARCEPGQRLEPHGACEHSALATQRRRRGCTASCQPETRPRVAAPRKAPPRLRGQAPPRG